MRIRCSRSFTQTVSLYLSLTKIKERISLSKETLTCRRGKIENESERERVCEFDFYRFNGWQCCRPMLSFFSLYQLSSHMAFGTRTWCASTVDTHIFQQHFSCCLVEWTLRDTYQHLIACQCLCMLSLSLDIFPHYKHICTGFMSYTIIPIWIWVAFLGACAKFSFRSISSIDSSLSKVTRAKSHFNRTKFVAGTNLRIWNFKAVSNWLYSLCMRKRSTNWRRTLERNFRLWLRYFCWWVNVNGSSQLIDVIHTIRHRKHFICVNTVKSNWYQYTIRLMVIDTGTDNEFSQQIGPRSIERRSKWLDLSWTGSGIQVAMNSCELSIIFVRKNTMEWDWRNDWYWPHAFSLHWHSVSIWL